MHTLGLNNEKQGEESAAKRWKMDTIGQTYSMGKIKKVSRALQKDNVF